MSTQHSKHEEASQLLACGVYQTRQMIDGLPAGSFVYYHNHGDPSHGIYVPESWRSNRAVFSKRGISLGDRDARSLLTPLQAEGLYRVKERFTCCENNCRQFEVNELVQLGYNDKAEALLFSPEWSGDALFVPSRGSKIDATRVKNLEQLSVRQAPQDLNGQSPTAGQMIH